MVGRDREERRGEEHNLLDEKQRDDYICIIMHARWEKNIPTINQIKLY